ncbi:aspartate aminotransferase family protein [Actinophytocola sp.]|uniref:aspartate aminotransferase family protein n=1 Tax=Actinophytocola sp. TaxID=1872138 RepID=UPI002ED443D5
MERAIGMAEVQFESPQSAHWKKRACEVIPGGVQSANRRKDDPCLVFTGGGKARIRTATGEELIDYWGGGGPNILGQAPEYVIEKTYEAMRGGSVIGAGITVGEVELAERLLAHVPWRQSILFACEGSTVTQYAGRLARAVTGRDCYIKAEGGYHGYWDGALVSVDPTAEWLGRPMPHSKGMLPEVVAKTMVVKYNDLGAIRGLLEQHGERIAAVMVEPVLHSAPTILPRSGYLRGLRELCDEFGSLLVFDEMVTGTRLHLGGYQVVEGVQPDLTAGGKAVSGGVVPLSYLRGRPELMDRFSTRPLGDVAWTGTYNAFPAALAAGLATDDVLANGEIHEHINRLGEAMRAGLRDIVAEAGIEASVLGLGSVYTLWFGPEPTDYSDVLAGDRVLFARHRRGLVRRGVWEKPGYDGAGRCVISAAHTQADIDLTLEAQRDALREALKVGDGA